MMSQRRKQTTAINMLPNISRSNIKQTVKYGRLIEYNMTKTFLEKSFTKCDAETIPRPLLKKQNWSYLWINGLILCFTVCQVEGY